MSPHESTTERITRIRHGATDDPAQRPVWIAVTDEITAQREQDRVDGLEDAPLAGWLVGVKDNIDVAGLPTTAAAPRPLWMPAHDAHAVARLRAAGAVVAGKTNLDQFATGLVGTRSPYGAPTSVADSSRISGGSSSGSAVAVARGLVDIALGTDTAGSGRIPAGFNGLVGVKPTLGLVSTSGVLPAAPSYDAVTVFARDLGNAERALDVMMAFDPASPGSRPWPADAPLAAPPRPRLAVPDERGLVAMEPVWRDAFERTVAQLDRDQFDVVTIDVSDLLAVARLLYDGALVAERTASFGHLLDGLGDSADPTVARIVAGGHRREATALVHDQQAVASALARARSLWEGTDVLLVPTAPGHPTTAEVTDDPVGVNSWLGTYTNFVNLLDMAALAMPVDAAIGRPFGITLVGPAFSDRVLLDVAARMRPDLAPLSPWLPAHHKVAVFGAHRRGGALTHELTDLGARFLREDHTAPEYTLHRLTTEPPRPGLVRSPEGASIICEVWALPAAAVSRFLTGIDAPLALGTVRLHDGTDVTGFVCEPWGLENSVDITASGGWLEHLASIDGEHR